MDRNDQRGVQSTVPTLSFLQLPMGLETRMRGRAFTLALHMAVFKIAVMGGKQMVRYCPSLPPQQSAERSSMKRGTVHEPKLLNTGKTRVRMACSPLQESRTMA